MTPAPAFAVLLAALLMAACRAAPGDPLPEWYPEERSPALELPSRPPPVRAEPIGPLTLERALTLARERNPDLRAAAERIGAAQARVGEAASAFYPDLGARVSYLRTDNPAQAFGMIVAQRAFTPSLDINDPGATDTYRPEVFGMFNLYRGGQDLHHVDAARHGLEVSERERDVLRNALADAVAATFFAHLAAQEEVAVAQASVLAVESEVTEARKRLTAGALLKSDVLSLEVRLAAARESGVRSRNAVEHAKAGIRLLLALGPAETFEVVSTAGAPGPAIPRDLADALAVALAERPELRAAASVLGARRSELAAEEGAFRPRVDVFGSYGQDHDSLQFDHDQDYWSLGVVVEMDLFSGYRKTERVRGAERRLAEARALHDKARLGVELEVRSALLDLEEARERVSVTEKSVAAADEALRLVREQYQGGTATVTRFLEAEVAQADARSRFIKARFAVSRAEAAVRRALGLWK